MSTPDCTKLVQGQQRYELHFPKILAKLLVPDAVNRRPNFRTSIDRSWSLSMPITGILRQRFVC